MKSLLSSRTIWLAIIQAIGSVVLVILTEVPSLVGYVGILKSILDILLRVNTSQPIKQ